MSIFYLDSDDEITSAAARIRGAEDVDVAVVLPAGSRIATSRINFRLLAREASSHSRRLSIVSPDASSRALAASAGLPVFASVTEYEEARDAVAAGPADGESATPAVRRGRDQPGAGDDRAGGASEAPTIVAGAAGAGFAAAASEHAPGRAPGPAGGRHGSGARSVHARPLEPAGPGVGGADTGSGGRATDALGAVPSGPARPRTAGHGGVGPSTGLGGATTAVAPRRRRWPLVVAGLVAIGLLAGSGAAVGYVVLPTATVTLQLEAVPVGPITFTGIADPDAVAADEETATIPATRMTVPLSAAGTFKASGKRVAATAATGTVRFENCDPARAYTITRGSIVRTGPGAAFATQEDVFLPVAILDRPQIKCQSRSVGVKAQREGPAGNVPAGAITRVPADANPNVIFVTNPAATSGGSREEYPKITEKDVSRAAAALTKQLDEQLALAAVAPPGIPAGAIAYPETALRGEVLSSEPFEEIVGREVGTFDLALTADGTVVVADPGPLEEIGAARIAARVPDGMRLRDGSIRVEVGAGIVAGELVRYAVRAEAEAVRPIAESAVRELVKGRTAGEAEAALAAYGTATVEIWPDWADTVTSLDARLQVTVVGVPPAEATPRPTPRPAPTRAPAPPPTASPSAPAPEPAPSIEVPGEDPGATPTPTAAAP